MRHFIPAFIAALALVGCGGFDPEAACESRCENQKAEGCLSSGTNCNTSCVAIVELYEAGLDQAEDSGCIPEYDTWVDCTVSAPTCATQEVINEMCAEEWLIWQNCM